MRKITPPRKVKAQLRLVLQLFGLFIVTLIVCGVGFVVLSRHSLISPLTRLLIHGNEDYVSEVKALCLENHLTCDKVQQIDPTSIQVTLDTGIIAYLSTKKDLKNQLTSLQQAMSQLTIKGRKLRTIDFRYVEAVVSF